MMVIFPIGITSMYSGFAKLQLLQSYIFKFCKTASAFLSVIHYFICIGHDVTLLFTLLHFAVHFYSTKHSCAVCVY